MATRLVNGTRDAEAVGRTVLDDNGQPREEFLGLEGFLLFAENHNPRGFNMETLYDHVKEALGERNFERMGWKKFYGSPTDFHRLRGKLLLENGNVNPEYIGMEGYIRHAREESILKIGKNDIPESHVGMQKPFMNASAALGETFPQLGWQQYQGFLSDLLLTQERIFLEDGRVRPNFVDMNGYALYAETYHRSDMSKAFTNVSAAVGGKKEMTRRGIIWKKFRGATPQYRRLLSLFKEAEMEMLLGQEGQRFVANTIFKSNTVRTYDNVSVLRRKLLEEDPEAFTRLGWVRESF